MTVPQAMPHPDPARRAANRRTALVLAAVALAFFVAALFKFKGLAP
ncbi:cytochrome oxidase small assembly protein [Aromatoleum toluclasticum]|nr:cytochrome oxidase small assembly protein [Aromatoleum toluclasticum]MCC4116324.1 cytochrome oxidase small assembly protein [Aromatoleum toluclasticum]